METLKDRIDTDSTISETSRATQPRSEAKSLSEIPEAASWIEVEGQSEDGFLGSSFSGPGAKASAILWATSSLYELGKIDYTVGSHGTVI
jgi:hypothetical protein